LDDGYSKHWDDKFRERRWGRYPPEDLVRFVGRTYGAVDHSRISVLEVGCGPGANLWFLHREGFKVAGIDGSSAAVEAAGERLAHENRGLNPAPPDLRVGDFSVLPWPDVSFDLAVDIFALYANPLAVIRSAVDGIFRVLKPGGRLYTKVWGRKTTGYGQGREIEPGTYDAIPAGPCQDMGVSHFFDRDEIAWVFSRFEVKALDVMTRTDSAKGHLIEEYACHLAKPL
jgi:SAM-dependent methyltransferase